MRQDAVADNLGAPDFKVDLTTADALIAALEAQAAAGERIVNRVLVRTVSEQMQS